MSDSLLFDPNEFSSGLFCLQKTTDLRDPDADPQIVAFLKPYYENVNVEEPLRVQYQITVSYLNSFITQRRRAAITTRKGMRSLVQSDKNWFEKPAFDNKKYRVHLAYLFQKLGVSGQPHDGDRPMVIVIKNETVISRFLADVDETKQIEQSQDWANKYIRKSKMRHQKKSSTEIADQEGRGKKGEVGVQKVDDRDMKIDDENSPPTAIPQQDKTLVDHMEWDSVLKDIDPFIIFHFHRSSLNGRLPDSQKRLSSAYNAGLESGLSESDFNWVIDSLKWIATDSVRKFSLTVNSWSERQDQNMDSVVKAALRPNQAIGPIDIRQALNAVVSERFKDDKFEPVRKRYFSLIESKFEQYKTVYAGLKPTQQQIENLHSELAFKHAQNQLSETDYDLEKGRFKALLHQAADRQLTDGEYEFIRVFSARFYDRINKDEQFYTELLQMKAARTRASSLSPAIESIVGKHIIEIKRGRHLLIKRTLTKIEFDQLHPIYQQKFKLHDDGFFENQNIYFRDVSNEITDKDWSSYTDWLFTTNANCVSST